jgi:hypothetical protein
MAFSGIAAASAWLCGNSWRSGAHRLALWPAWRNETSALRHAAWRLAYRRWRLALAAAAGAWRYICLLLENMKRGYSYGWRRCSAGCGWRRSGSAAGGNGLSAGFSRQWLCLRMAAWPWLAAGSA